MSILGNDDGKFQVGWFRGGLPQQPPSYSRLAAALARLCSARGAPYVGPVPHLPGSHILVARRACGCIMIHCPQEPEVVTLSGPWCVGDEHDASVRSPSEFRAVAGAVDDDGGRITDAEFARLSIAAATPELRRQIAEEIAAAIESDLGQFGPDADRVITRSARSAREIGGKA